MADRKFTVFTIFTVFTVFTFTLFAAILFASSVVAQQTASARAVQAGVAAAVRGEVRLVSFRTPKTIGRDIASGDPVFLGDKVEAGPKAGLQIMLMDETIFTIGPDSAIVIDKFIYDPDKGAGKVSATVLRGVFRFVSGRVAANKPSDMVVKLPNGTIGIRGTSAGGFVRAGASEIVLLGPGPNNNVGEPGGRIIVSGGGGDVDISRVNFGTLLSGGSAPTAPVRWNAQKMNSLTGALRAAPPRRAPDGDGSTATGSDDGGESQSASEQAGQDVGSAVETSGLLSAVAAGQDTLVSSTGDEIIPAISGITTVTELTQITSGSFDYGTTHVSFPHAPNSSYDFSYSIDFAAKIHTGKVVINTSTADGFAANASGTFQLQADPFSHAGSTLSLTEGGTGTHVPGLNANDNQIKVSYKFINDGAIATRIEHEVEYREPAAGGGATGTADGSNDRTK